MIDRRTLLKAGVSLLTVGLGWWRSWQKKPTPVALPDGCLRVVEVLLGSDPGYRSSPSVKLIFSDGSSIVTSQREAGDLEIETVDGWKQFSKIGRGEVVVKRDGSSRFPAHFRAIAKPGVWTFHA